MNSGKAWETPRNIAILAGTVAAIAGAIAGGVGYKIGSQPPPVIQVQLLSPIPTQAVPAR